MESAQGDCCSSPGMGDLPECCVASILRLTTPRDVARLACVSRVFRDASNSDFVWQTMLPPVYEPILALAPDALASSRSKKEIDEYLCTPVLLENGTQNFWLDRATGGACRSIGARGLFIAWGDEPHDQRWANRVGTSRLTAQGYLKQVCWIEGQGNFQCSLPPGTFVFLWRLFGEIPGLGRKLVQFSAEGPDRLPFVVDPNGEGSLRPPWGWGSARKWVELDVGKFKVRGPAKIQFSVIATMVGHWRKL